MSSAVSMSPASPMAGSIRTAPRATTSTTSEPVMNRAMSKSWIVMSRNIPPESRMYAIGGGAGSRLEIRTGCGSPTRPAATASRTDACPGSNRLLKPIWNGTPACSTAPSPRSTSSRASDTGFSQKIALPARAAWTMRSAWVGVLVQIATASTSGDASSSSTDTATGTRSSSPTLRALATCESYTALTAAPRTRRASRSACMRPMRPTPITPIRQAGVARGAAPAGALSVTAFIRSVLSQRADVLPAPGLDGLEQRRLHADPFDGLGEAGAVPAALGDRSAELVVLDDDEVLEADPVRAAGHEVPVVREAVAAEDRPVAGVQAVLGEVDLQLVELLEVPPERAASAVHVEGHLALRADDRAARLERAARPAGELAQHPGVVLVRDGAGRVAGPASAVVRGRAGRVRERALADERLGRPDDAGDRPEQQVREVDEEPPRQDAERVAAVHREEAPAVVGDLAQRAGRDELRRVAHERRPAVVVANARDDAGAAGGLLGADGLLRRAAHRLLAEHV